MSSLLQDVHCAVRRLTDDLRFPLVSVITVGLVFPVYSVARWSGVYSVMSHAVAHRTQEIGIRMALGARPHDVSQVFLHEGLVLALVGVGAGLVCALLVTRFLKRLLLGVAPTDMGTFTAVSLVLVLVILLASYLPARRASRVVPMIPLWRSGS